MTQASLTKSTPIAATAPAVSPRWVIGIFIAFALALGALYTYLYNAGGGQPALIVAGACGVGALLAGTAFYLALKAPERFGFSIVLTLAGIMILFLGAAVGLRGVLWMAAGAGGLLIFAFSVIMWRRFWLGLIALAVFALALFGLHKTGFIPSGNLVMMIDNLDVIQGYTSFRMMLVQVSLPAVSLFILAFWITGIIYRRSIDTIRDRLLFSFIALVLVTALIVIGVGSVVSMVTGERQVLTQLEIINTARQAQINNWTNRLTSTLTVTADNTEINSRILSLLKRQDLAGTSIYTFDQQYLTEAFRRVIQSSQLYDEMYILDAKGQILVTTRAAGQEQFDRKLEWELLAPGLTRTFNTPLFVSRGQNFLLASVQLVSADGQTLGILVGRASMERLAEILNNYEGLGTTGEAYLVDNGRRMRTPSRFPEWDLLLGRMLETRGARSVQPNSSLSDAYFGYRTVPVLGVQNWLPDLKVALVTEQDQMEAFASVYIAIANSALAALVVIILAGLASAITTRSIAVPLTRLAETATRIAGGDFGLTTGLQRADEIGDLASAFDRMTEQLRGLITDLEGRVAERTEALERRAVQIQAASQIARDISGFNNLGELLESTVDLIRDRFGFYHAGIFLADDNSEFAVLQAATGDAGAEMLARGHKLKIGEVGIVGYVVHSGQPRIALDVGEDQVHFRNPLLPRTRSEMGLPLRASDRIIGALDVQSDLPSAFTEEDIQVLQTMADQLALAIVNTRLLERLQSSVSELETTYQQTTQAAWQGFLQASHRVYAYRYRESQVEPAQDTGPETGKAIQTGKLIITTAVEQEKEITTVAIPILLRSHILGALTLRFAGSGVSQEVIELVQNASSRLAIALENARLLEEIQMRSEREHMVGAISSKIRATSSIDGILRTAVSELGRAMGVSEVLIQLQGEE